MRKAMLNSTFSKYSKSILCTINFHNMYLEIKEIGDGSVLRRKSKGQVLIFLPNSSFCRSFRSTNASDDIIFMYLDWSAIVSCAVFRNTEIYFYSYTSKFSRRKRELTKKDHHRRTLLCPERNRVRVRQIAGLYGFLYEPMRGSRLDNSQQRKGTPHSGTLRKPKPS